MTVAYFRVYGTCSDMINEKRNPKTFLPIWCFCCIMRFETFVLNISIVLYVHNTNLFISCRLFGDAGWYVYRNVQYL